MVTKSIREIILQKLTLVMDEPEENRLEFNFDEYAKQITNVMLDESIPTPFTIGVNSEWGGGKTTLIKATYKKIENEIESGKIKDTKIIWFETWKYERIGIIPSLLQKIKKEVNGNEKAKKSIKFGGLIAFDAILRRSIGITLSEIQKCHEEIFEEISTLDEKINKLIDNQKFIIFIDDLDRCSTDNILDVLESIKNFLSVKNIIFIIAADMSKIERAWALKYNSKEGYEEGREYVEKFFQLKLTLPEKSQKELKSYAERFLNPERLSDIDRLIYNSPHNPRKIKRVLNILYFILKNFNNSDMEDSGYSPNDYLEVLVIWISISLHHPTIAEIAKWSPFSLIEASEICLDMKTISALKKEFSLAGDFKNLSERIRNTRDTNKLITYETYRIIEYVVNNDNSSYRILKHLGNIESNGDQKVSAYEMLVHIINKAGMIG